jgi:hypothetical protein
MKTGASRFFAISLTGRRRILAVVMAACTGRGG